MTHLLAHQVRYDGLIFRRNAESVFFVVGLPMLYLVIFTAIFGDQQVTWQLPGQPAGPLEVSSYMTASFLSIGVVSAGFLDTLISVVQQRETGLLERLRTTPLTARTVVASRCLLSVLLSLLVAVVLLSTARFGYSVPVQARHLPALTATIVLGALCTTAIAYAVSCAVRSARAVTPIALGITLCLFFLSGNFFLIPEEPAFMTAVKQLFPVAHLNDAVLTALNPNAAGGAWSARSMLVLTAWGFGGALVAARRMRWSPWR
jgi:ABC-2 type transport system permease protein